MDNIPGYYALIFQIILVQSPAGDHFWKGWFGWDDPTAAQPGEKEEEPHIDENLAAFTCEKPPAEYPENGLNRVPKPIPVAGNPSVPLPVDWACVCWGVAVTTGAAGVGATVVTTITGRITGWERIGTRASFHLVAIFTSPDSAG